MSRDHKKLRVFHDAHPVATSIYRQTREFARDELFGLRAQMRRAAVSVACNIVEGNARATTRDYLRFLNVALGSACELHYLVQLASELGLSTGDAWEVTGNQCATVVKQLQRLAERVEGFAVDEGA